MITHIVSTFKVLMDTYGKKPDPKGEVESDYLIEGMISLLIRLGGNINRKIFIPGESR